MKIIKGIYLFLFLLSGCVEDFDLELDTVEPKLVVDGLITNQEGPYYVRLIKSHTGKFIEPDPDSIYLKSVVPVKDAQIIISDDAGQIDTLVPLIEETDLSELQGDYNSGYYKILYDNYGNIIDTLFITDPLPLIEYRGFYKTQNLVGIPGRTYYLTIISEGKEYHAIDYMQPVPDIDSLGYIKKVMEKDGQEYFIPLLYFSEPQDADNYYLIQTHENILSRVLSWSFWEFSIISDEYLQPYVNGLNVSLGANPRGFEYPRYSEGDKIYLALSSLSKSAYEFYEILLKQFESDGGAYKPSPASPPTNLSNGALGFFRASATGEKELQIPYPFE